MKAGRNFNFRFLLKMLFWGIVFGTLSGYLGDHVFQRFNHPYLTVLEPHLPLLIGATSGLVVAAVCYLLARRAIFDYVTGLRDQLANLGDLPFNLEDDPSLSDQAGAFQGLFDYEVSRLAEYRDELLQLSREAEKAIRKAKSRDSAPLDSYLKVLAEKKTQTAKIKRELEQLHSWIQESVLPVGDFEPGEVAPEKMDEFEGMIDFQKNLQNRLADATRSLEKLKSEVQPWRQGPEQLREAIESANRILVEAGRIFQEFPDEKLPEQAEKLRQETQRWDSLAERIESGYEKLVNEIDNASTEIEELTSEARCSPPPEDVWKNIKVELEAVDNKIEQIREMTREHWAHRLNEQVELLGEKAGWLDESLGQLQNELEDEAESISELDALAGELQQFIASGEE